MASAISKRLLLAWFSSFCFASSVFAQYAPTGNSWDNRYPLNQQFDDSVQSEFDSMAIVGPPTLPFDSTDSSFNNQSAVANCNSCFVDDGCIIQENSSDAFSDFISPITNPIFFEDPRILSEVRTIFMQQKIPLAAGCGEFQVFAGQLRAALSKNSSLIINKAGYVTSNNSPVSDGWLDFSAGLKFNIMRDEEFGSLLSSGFTFEAPTGDSSALQGNGDGELHVFLSGATRIGECAHWMSGFGARIPMNSTDESQSLYWSNHWDYQVRKRVYLLTELNWFHWLKSGEDGCFCFEGLDLFNFGSPNAAGNDIVTSAVGLKFRKTECSEFGFAFEFPLTERRDFLDNRITADWILRF